MNIWKSPIVEFTDKSVLVLMDPIEAYQNLYNEKHIQNINKLIDAANKKDITVVFTQWIRVKPDNVVDEIDRKGHWSCFVPNNQTNILKTIKVDYNSTIVPVKHTNAFMHTEFTDLLQDKKHIVLGGCWLESCIINTARAAIDRNCSVSVVSNCSTGHFPFNYISLFDIQMVYGNIVRI